MLNKYNSFKVFVANAITDSIKPNVKNFIQEFFTEGLIDKYKAKWNRTTAQKGVDKLSTDLREQLFSLSSAKIQSSPSSFSAHGVLPENYLEALQKVKYKTYIYVFPEIPENLATNAIASYANDINYNDIILLADDTIWGSAKSGFLITRNKTIYSKHSQQNCPIIISNDSDFGGILGEFCINDKKIFSGGIGFPIKLLIDFMCFIK